MDPPFVAADGMDFVHNDVLDRAEQWPCLRGRHHEIEGFRCCDENIRRVPDHCSTAGLRRIAGTDLRPQGRQGDPQSPGFLCDARQRRFQVPLDIVVEGFQGRDIKDADARRKLFVQRLLHQMVDSPEEGSQRLPGTGGGKNQGVFSLRDARPAKDLRRRRRPERTVEPCPHDGVKLFENGMRRHSLPLLRTV